MNYYYYLKNLYLWHNWTSPAGNQQSFIMDVLSISGLYIIFIVIYTSDFRIRLKMDIILLVKFIISVLYFFDIYSHYIFAQTSSIVGQILFFCYNSDFSLESRLSQSFSCRQTSWSSSYYNKSSFIVSLFAHLQGLWYIQFANWDFYM